MIVDFAAFKNSSFAETVIYTHSSIPLSISAVIFRNKSLKGVTGGKSDNPLQFYPMVAEVDRTDIAAVTENEDKITCVDEYGVSRSYRVQKILSSDPGCFKLGCV